MLKSDGLGRSSCDRSQYRKPAELYLRPEKFCVGSRKFDPKNVGFKSELNNDGSCTGGGYYGEENVATLIDTSKYGNSNDGHATKRHGVCLSNEDKDALVEFLKTL